jgi:hypothetical protein
VRKESIDVRHLEGDRGSIRLDYDPAQIKVEEIVQATEKVNASYRVTVGEPKDVPEPSAAVDFRIISSGGPFHLDEALSKSKPTLVDFACMDDKACAQADAWLSKLARKHSAARRRVDVGGPKDNTAAAAQMKRDFGVEGVPYVRLYAKDGIFVKEWKAPAMEEVDAALKGLK